MREGFGAWGHLRSMKKLMKFSFSFPEGPENARALKTRER